MMEDNKLYVFYFTGLLVQTITNYNITINTKLLILQFLFVLFNSIVKCIVLLPSGRLLHATRYHYM